VVDVARGADVSGARVVDVDGAVARDSAVDESSPPHAASAEPTRITSTARVRLFMRQDDT